MPERCCGAAACCGSMMTWAVATVCLISAAMAGAQPAPDGRAGLPEMVALGAGYSGIFRERDRPVFSVEYRFGESRKGLHTALLLGWNSDARYLNFSLGYSRYFGARWTAMIATGPGVYSRESDGDDLGSPLEFLSRIEVARIFSRQRRVGLRLSHISNAHVSPHNPGNESLALVVAFPVGG